MKQQKEGLLVLLVIKVRERDFYAMTKKEKLDYRLSLSL